MEAEIRAFLLLDTTLMAMLTGGVYAWSESAPNGINIYDTPSAYDANGILRPCAIVKAPEESAWGSIADKKVRSVSGRLEIYIYDEGRNSRSTTVTPAYERIVTLLDAESLQSVGRIRHFHKLDGRDTDMSNALFTKASFQVVRIRGNG